MKQLKNGMKLVRILALLTQLGFSVAFPLAGFVLAAVWLAPERFAQSKRV